MKLISEIYFCFRPKIKIRSVETMENCQCVLKAQTQKNGWKHRRN